MMYNKDKNEKNENSEYKRYKNKIYDENNKNDNYDNDTKKNKIYYGKKYKKKNDSYKYYYNKNMHNNIILKNQNNYDDSKINITYTNTNNSEIKIDTFHNKNNIDIKNAKEKLNTKSKYIIEPFNYEKKVRNKKINKTNIYHKKKNSKSSYFKEISINIKLEEKKINEEIILNLKQKNKISEIINEIMNKYDLNEEIYYEKLLNIISNAIDILNNIDEINPSNLAIDNVRKNKNYLYKESNNINDSFLLDIIDKKNYKLFIGNILDDIYDIKIKQIRNFSV